MKNCPNCSSEVEDAFDICWNCKYSFVEEKVLDDSDFKLICPKCNTEVKAYLSHCPYCHNNLSKNRVGNEKQPLNHKQVECLRCKVALDYQGNFKFNEDTRAGSMGNFLEEFINKESLDFYSCPSCGKVEFFLPGFEEN